MSSAEILKDLLDFLQARIDLFAGRDTPVAKARRMEAFLIKGEVESPPLSALHKGKCEVKLDISEFDGATPGPWSIFDQRSMAGEIWIGVNDPEGGSITHASVRYGCGEAEDIGDIEANARLIAAAPVLLSQVSVLTEALRELIAAAEHMPTRTAGSGHAESKFDYSLESWAVWGLDRALKKARDVLARTALSAQAGSIEKEDR